jgi:hypothetical protein
MEMPQNCDKCRFQSDLRLYCDAMPYNFCGNTDDIKRPDWCPLVEVKEPHGNLVDLDQMVNDYWDSHSMVIGHKELDEIEVIIEAEGREE